ncbi:MAG: hypothetical protein K6E57_07460 [Fibrobacter sp.]|nr:hypothetical protein [Fibrobacter sp.]
MNRLIFIASILLSTAFVFAGGLAAQPESSVPTPAERSEFSRETPDLGAKEKADWQKMRAERKVAREQILSKLRASSSAEKKGLRNDVSQKRNEKSRFEGESQKKQPRERQPFYERPDSHNMNPMRGMPMLPMMPPPMHQGDHSHK